MGSDWNASQIATLRTLNPATVALTSINACEGADGLPERFYLHNITRPNSTKGRLESWFVSFQTHSPTHSPTHFNLFFLSMLGPPLFARRAGKALLFLASVLGFESLGTCVCGRALVLMLTCLNECALSVLMLVAQTNNQKNNQTNIKKARGVPVGLDQS